MLARAAGICHRSSVAEYLTTKEVAAYLRLNEKKVYALVAAGQLPAARVSGKWLFPRGLIDRWIEAHAVYPASGLMGALLDQMLIIQGSDDLLLAEAVEAFQAASGIPVPMATIGSMAGLRALDAGLAHLAGCHVTNAQVAEALSLAAGCYLVNLFERQQGLIVAGRAGAPTGLEAAVERGARWAERQPGSGTHRLTAQLLAEAGLDAGRLLRVGPFGSHLEVALAVLQGQADCGLGIQPAAERCGLGFVPLTVERYKLAVPVAFAGHPVVVRFMDFLLDRLGALEATPGYRMGPLGRLEIIGPPHDPPRPRRRPQPPGWKVTG